MSYFSLNNIYLDEIAMPESYILCPSLAEINNASLHIAQCYHSTQKVLNVLTYFEYMELISSNLRIFIDSYNLI